MPTSSKRAAQKVEARYEGLCTETWSPGELDLTTLECGGILQGLLRKVLWTDAIPELGLWSTLTRGGPTLQGLGSDFNKVCRNPGMDPPGT